MKHIRHLNVTLLCREEIIECLATMILKDLVREVKGQFKVARDFILWRIFLE